MAGISKKKIKTKKGIVIKYTITYYDIFGKQHTSGLYETQKEAKKDLYKYENIDNSKEEIKIYEIFKIFLEKAERKYAKNTYAIYKMYYEKYIKELEKLPYKKLNTVYLQKFFDKIEKHSPYVAQTCLKMSKSAANDAIKHGLIKENIFSKIENIKLPKANINHLSIEELKAILEECQKSYPKYYTLLFLLIGSGMRIGETLALEKEDYDCKTQTITVNKEFTYNELKYKTKTESSKRRIYLFDTLAKQIEKHINESDKKCKLLFPNNAGNYINVNCLRRRFFKPLLKKCGITKRVRLHDLRGSYIDLILSSNLSAKFAQQQAGHSDIQTTLNVYARNNSDMVENAMKKLDEVFYEQKYEQNESKNRHQGKSNILSFPETRKNIG